MPEQQEQDEYTEIYVLRKIARCAREVVDHFSLDITDGIEPECIAKLWELVDRYERGTRNANFRV